MYGGRYRGQVIFLRPPLSHILNFLRHHTPATITLVLVMMFFCIFLLNPKPDNFETIEKSKEVQSSLRRMLNNVNGGNQLADSPVSSVIILSYMRSGSSLVGQLFNQNEKALYIFEPLWETYFRIKGDEQMPFSNRKIKHPPYKEELLYNQILKGIFQCDFSNMPLGAIAPDPDLHWFMREVGYRGQEKYRQCVYIKNGTLDDVDCLSYLKEECEKSTIRAAKVIRLDINSTRMLIETIPGLKVIHLVRDPRASLFSQKKVEQTECDIRCEAKKRCMKMDKNLQHAYEIEMQYPGHIMQLRYEDLADRPIETAIQVYSFLGHTMPQNVTRWLIENTGSGKPDDWEFGTRRANSSATAHAWEKSIPLDMVGQIDKICMPALKRMSYEPWTEIAKRVSRYL